MPASRARTTTVTKEMLNATWAMTIVSDAERGPPAAANRTSSEIPTTISGRDEGNVEQALHRAAGPRKRCRASASASIVPSTVAMSVEMTPTMRLPSSPLEDVGRRSNRPRYQCRVKPVHCDREPGGVERERHQDEQREVQEE